MYTLNLEIGCLVDGLYGVDHFAAKVVEFANHHGFYTWVPGEFNDAELHLMSNRNVDGFEDEILGQGNLLDLSVEWLNDHVAEAGHYFGFHDGDFFYQTDEWWSQEV